MNYENVFNDTVEMQILENGQRSIPELARSLELVDDVVIRVVE